MDMRRLFVIVILLSGCHLLASENVMTNNIPQQVEGESVTAVLDVLYSVMVPLITSLLTSVLTSAVYYKFKKKKERHALDVKFFEPRKEIYIAFMDAYYAVKWWVNLIKANVKDDKGNWQNKNEWVFNEEADRRICELQSAVKTIKMECPMVKFSFSYSAKDTLRITECFCHSLDKMAFEISKFYYESNRDYVKCCRLLSLFSEPVNSTACDTIMVLYKEMEESYKRTLDEQGKMNFSLVEGTLSCDELLDFTKNQFENAVSAFLSETARGV